MKQINTIFKYIIFLSISLVTIYTIYDSINHIRAEVYHRNGYIKSERNYPHLAIKDFEKSVKLIPWETHYRLQLAKAYENTAKKFPDQFNSYINLAIKEYKTLMKMNNLNPWFKARLGLIYHDIHKKNKSEEKYKELALNYTKSATDTDNKNPLFTLHYAHLLYNYKDIENAIIYYKKTIEYDFDMGEAHFNLAHIYVKEKNIPEALNYYKNVDTILTKLENRPKNLKTKDVLKKIETFQNARVFLIKDHLNKNEHKKALTLINKLAISIEKYELLAKYYEKINQPKSALSLYTQLKNQLKTDKYNSKINKLSNK